jgi:hypothetical protein
MTNTTHDKTVTWLSEYMKARPNDLMNFNNIRRQTKKVGESFISCYLLDNKFLYGRFLREARELANKNDSE